MNRAIKDITDELSHCNEAATDRKLIQRLHSILMNVDFPKLSQVQQDDIYETLACVIAQENMNTRECRIEAVRCLAETKLPEAKQYLLSKLEFETGSVKYAIQEALEKL